MKSTSVLLGLLLSLPAVAFACSCIAVNFESALKLTDAAFRGTVVRKLKNVGDLKVFEVRVNRLFKCCNFQQSNHIIVTTRTNSAACGINLSVNASYAFTGYRSTMSDGIKKQLGNNPKKISSVFGATLCDFVTKWADVPSKDLNLLRRYDNTKCVAKCDVGGDCLKGQYCDFGTCKRLDAPCTGATVNCVAEPCSVSTCIAPSTCYNNYCGGCNAIFLDPANTRVC